MIRAISQVNPQNPAINRYNGDFSYAKPSSIRPKFTSIQPQEHNKNEHKTLYKILLGTAIASIGILCISRLSKIKSLVEKTTLKKEFKTRFDNIWNEVSKDFEQKGLKIEKPQLNFSKNEDLKNLGSYFPTHNKVSLNLSYFNNIEYIAYKKNGRKIERFYNFPLSEKELTKLKSKNKINDNWTIKKLNENEKLFFFTHVMSHELRHCAQFHLILNDSAYGAKFLLKNLAKKLKVNNPNSTNEELMELAKTSAPYWAKFKPSQILSNLSINAPITHDNRKVRFYTSAFARHYEHYNKNSYDKYRLNALEIDANAFASAYLNKNKKFQTNCDPAVLKFISFFEKFKSNKNAAQFFEKRDLAA